MNAGPGTRPDIIEAGRITVVAGNIPAVLSMDLPATRIPCLQCEDPIGCRPFVHVLIWPSNDAGCPCGQLAASVYLIHKSCLGEDWSVLMELAQVQSITCIRHQGRRIW